MDGWMGGWVDGWMDTLNERTWHETALPPPNCRTQPSQQELRIPGTRRCRCKDSRGLRFKDVLEVFASCSLCARLAGMSAKLCKNAIPAHKNAF
eukprot:gene24437-biopygen11900